ncbi:hypothetical protein ACH5RR_041515 [Cinchona calisaya]|uniref:Uncharacterized protein n=1 Tax=Cinchona calisaya TaxID=153742 RepID=A0ABD2XZ79_9GENT
MVAEKDVAYKPEVHLQTRKCEPDAGADVVKICESLPVGHVETNIGCLHPAETFVSDRWAPSLGILASKSSVGFTVRIEIQTRSRISTDAALTSFRLTRTELVEIRCPFVQYKEEYSRSAFSIGITEVLNMNLLIELSADDIEYVYHSLIAQPVSARWRNLANYDTPV